MLDRATMIAAFDKLASELSRRGLRCDMFVVGGAAMALAYVQEKRTRDIDAVFSDPAAVYEAARTVARRMGLPGDWLNDAVRSYLLGPDVESRPVYERPSLQIAVASPRYLLAMKLLAARVEQDAEDIRVLYGICGLTSASEGVQLLRCYIPDASIPDHTMELLAQMFGTSSESAPPPP
ncbi:MAG: DUF6036 family nucleotidyltransferase [Actinomycetota bacterium]|jgi:hypothetical protein|nr:DUF6036 family nucleotidyltransferase [Actinomycetota bacterium]